MKQIVVGIGEYQVSDDPEAVLVTFSLGSCVAVTVYDPMVKVGGLLHLMLPESDINPLRAKEKPGMFADTGIPLMLDECLRLGAQKARLQVKVAGGAEMLDSSGFFMIGKRNLTAVRKILWQNGLFIVRQDVGGNVNRSVFFELSTGKVTVKISGEGVKEL